MLAYCRLRWELWRLERAQRIANRRCENELEAAKARKAPEEEIEILEHESGYEDYFYQNEIHKLLSRYLIAEAYRLVIPVPDHKRQDMWDTDPETQMSQLSQAGINEVRAAIRAEKKARVERFLMWVPGVVGILGTLIGLASILVGKGK